MPDSQASVRHVCPTCGGPATEKEAHTKEMCINFQQEHIKSLRRELATVKREKMDILAWAAEGLPIIMKYQAELED